MNKYPGWLIHLILTLSIIKSTQSQCINPHDIPGQCINFMNCEPLKRFFKTYGNLTTEFMRQSQCGFDGNIPKVCCPPIGTQITLEHPSYGGLVAPQCGNPNAPLPKIVNGQPALLGNWPWMAALGYWSNKNPTKIFWGCDGSLISSRHVLTAAHCKRKDVVMYAVRLGDLNLDESADDGANPIDMAIDRFDIHPNYSAIHYTNDIAVIRLKEHVEFTPNLQPICLPFVDELINNDFVSSVPFIAGWGAVNFKGPHSPALLHARVPIVSLERCINAYNKFPDVIIEDRNICAGYEKRDRDACTGDSGGPLMYPIKGNFYAIGVVSFGYRCAMPGYYGVYTKVEPFLNFIKSKLN